jgi:hypothetical protein
MSFLGSLTGSDAIEKAAKIQAKATREAVAAQREAGNQAVGYYSPYREGGLSAWDKLMAVAGVKGLDAQKSAYDDFRDSPGVDFLKERGVQAIDRSATAGGSLRSGRTLIDLDRFGQGLAEQSFGDWKNDLRYLSDTGYNASGASANARMGTAARVGDLTMDGARTQADLAMRQGEILPNLLTGVASIGGDIFGRWLEGRAKRDSSTGGGFAGTSYRPSPDRPLGYAYYGGPR